jgi:hypothetical protein
LSGAEPAGLHAWRRACNYLVVGMIYLKDNPRLSGGLQWNAQLGVETTILLLLTDKLPRRQKLVGQPAH